jgi:tetratricopeptide (TPR) repeat protein
MAGQLGLDAQALAHLRRAGELADAGEVPSGRRDIYSELAWSEITAGNYLDGIRAMEKAAGFAPNSLGTQSSLTRMHSYIGNLDKANEYAAETRSRIAQGRGGAWAAVHGPTVAYTRLQAEGRYAEAEPHIRASIVAFEGADRTKTYIQGIDIPETSFGAQPGAPRPAPGGRGRGAGSDIIIGHIIEAYVRLLSEVRGTPAAAGLTIEPAAEAFRLANAARGRSVQKALAASATSVRGDVSMTR